jgi:hypothetical protein
MNTLQVYELCGTVAQAVPDDDRAAFASLVLRATLGLPNRPQLYRQVSAHISDLRLQELLRLMAELRDPRSHPGARRWLRDAGWIGRMDDGPVYLLH